MRHNVKRSLQLARWYNEVATATLSFLRIRNSTRVLPVNTLLYDMDIFRFQHRQEPRSVAGVRPQQAVEVAALRRGQWV